VVLIVKSNETFTFVSLEVDTLIKVNRGRLLFFSHIKYAKNIIKILEESKLIRILEPDSLKDVCLGFLRGVSLLKR
jgi:hypothetical protein